MPEKVKLAILDKDLKARVFRRFPLTSDGGKIDVISAGKGYFMPKFDNDSYIEFPYRNPLTFWKRSWTRVYVAIRGADKCINFKTEEVSGPDPKQAVDATSSSLIKNFGKEEKGVPWYIWVLFLILIGIALKVFGVIV
jgi:hypothetical protein